MGTIVLFIAASLDGFIADPQGGVAWLERFNVEGEDHGYGRFLSGVGAVVMGATTYEQDVARGGWPYGDRPTWVFTHRRLASPERSDVRFVGEPVADIVPAIRASTDRDVFLVGGANLIGQFLAAGAIDELILFIVPVVLGAGIRLFESTGPVGAKLLGTKSYATGLVELRYRLSP
jgi:dihydrofolate reductase